MWKWVARVSCIQQMEPAITHAALSTGCYYYVDIVHMYAGITDVKGRTAKGTHGIISRRNGEHIGKHWCTPIYKTKRNFIILIIRMNTLLPLTNSYTC